MLDLHTKKDIEKIAADILRGSKSMSVFPTPVDNIVDYAELVVRNDIDVSKVQGAYIARASTILNRALSKVRGVLDRGTKEIFLDLSQINSRKNFVKLHEVGHGVIPWQKQAHQFLDDDESLDPDINEQFEAEANYFASTVLFQLDEFKYKMNSLELGLPSAMHLAKVFGSSNHAAIRKYVECSSYRCALLVLEKGPHPGHVPLYRVRNYFQSEKFTKTFGTIEWSEDVGYTWPFVQDYYHKKRFKTDGSLTFLSQEKMDLEYHFFNSSYNGFVLLFPKGEVKQKRTKIITQI